MGRFLAGNWERIDIFELMNISLISIRKNNQVTRLKDSSLRSERQNEGFSWLLLDLIF